MMHDRGCIEFPEGTDSSCFKSARVMMPQGDVPECTGNAWFLWVMHCGGSEPTDGGRQAYLAPCNGQPDVSLGEKRT